jgi:hypothetical protein
MTNIALAARNLQNVMIELGWTPQLDEQTMGFFVDLGEPHRPVASIFAAISIEGEQFVIYFNFGIVAPVDRLDETARFIARANWGLMVGNFEMDYADGQIRFKSSLDFTGADLTETLIRNAIRPAMRAVETYAGGLVSVVAHGKSASEAIRDVETDLP